MRLLAWVEAVLTEAEVHHCLIGAAAMAAHGVPRSTLDLDFLTTDRGALEAALWRSLEDQGVEVDLRRGDRDDPLAGVVRCSAGGERAVDLIVGRFAWQGRIVERARVIPVQGVQVPVAEAADLILLKLFAGGPQDLWDIQQMLAGAEGTELTTAVESRLSDLPTECKEAWRNL